MWKLLTRLLLAGWFIGMIGLAIWNGHGAAAQGGGSERLFFPIVEVGDLTLRDYVGLAVNCVDPRNCNSGSGGNYFTVRADGSEWQPLAATVLVRSAAWSPDGQYFIYGRNNPDPDAPPSIQTVLVTVATRERRVIAESSTEPLPFAPAWSSDSRRLALVGTTALYIYEVETNGLATYALPEAIYVRDAHDIVWSPDSQQVAWSSGWSNGQAGDVWVWTGGGSTPQRVYRGDLWEDDPFFWSPDGARLLINYFGANDRSRRVLESTPLGAPAQVLLENSTLQGWVEDGSRMVLRDNSMVYLANADGTGVSLFFNQSSIREMLPSPQGDRIAIFGHDSRLYFKATDGSAAQWVEGCDGGIEWRPDGQQVLCNGYKATLVVIDLTGSAPVILREATNFSWGGTAEFLSPSAHLLALDRGRPVTDPYPHLKYDGTYVFSTRTGIYKAIRSPEGVRYPVIEWRYMP